MRMTGWFTYSYITFFLKLQILRSEPELSSPAQGADFLGNHHGRTAMWDFNIIFVHVNGP